MQLHAYYIAYIALFLAFSTVSVLKDQQKGNCGGRSYPVARGRKDKDVCAMNKCTFPTG